jgi:hypothetical protein
MKIFNDFLPETQASWMDNKLNLDMKTAGRWFEDLTKSREDNQGLLNILTSS